MADLKNTARNKRKYTEARKGITERNREAKALRHETRLERMKNRTLSLIGKPVKFGGQTFEVKDVIFADNEDYPKKDKGARSGSLLRISNDNGDRLVPRRKVKPVVESA